MPTSRRYQSVIPQTGLSQATKDQMVRRCSKCPRETTDEFARQHKFFSSNKSVVQYDESRGHASRDLTAFQSVFILHFVVLAAIIKMSAQSIHVDSNDSRAADVSRVGLAASSSSQAPTANDLLLAAYDPARLHPLAGLGDKLDYLLLDDDKTNELPGADTAIPSRGWSDDLCYGTGTMYLGGASSDLFQATQFAIASSRFAYFLRHPRHPAYPILSLLIVFVCHMFMQVLPPVLCGGYGRVFDGRSLSQILGYGSIAFSIPSHEEVLLLVIRLALWVRVLCLRDLPF